METEFLLILEKIKSFLKAETYLMPSFMEKEAKVTGDWGFLKPLMADEVEILAQKP